MRKFSMAILPAVMALILAACGGQAPTTGEVPTTDSGGSVAPTSGTGAGGVVDATAEATSDLSGAVTAEPLATPDMLSETATSGTGAVANDDILAMLQADGRFNTLVTAIQAAGIEQQLQNIPNFTLFAPTDTAFAALPQDQLNSLLSNPQQLGDILLYHVADQSLMAQDVMQTTTIPTLAGSAISVSTQGGSVLLNNSAQVVGADMMVGNGVVHAIDQVLIPGA